VLSLYTPLINALSDYLRESVKKAQEAVSAYYPEAAEMPVSTIVFTGGIANSRVMRDAIGQFLFLKDIKLHFSDKESGSKSAFGYESRCEVMVYAKYFKETQSFVAQQHISRFDSRIS
jgi:hypothetical protein